MSSTIEDHRGAIVPFKDKLVYGSSKGSGFSEFNDAFIWFTIHSLVTVLQSIQIARNVTVKR
jgi:hypothetical protein